MLVSVSSESDAATACGLCLVGVGDEDWEIGESDARDEEGVPDSELDRRKNAKKCG